jgi:hypothetical protein
VDNSVERFLSHFLSPKQRKKRYIERDLNFDHQLLDEQNKEGIDDTKRRNTGKPATSSKC